jgi:predicted membrane protein
MSYELISNIEFAFGVYIIGIFAALVICNIHELKTHEVNHYKTSQAILWPISLLILILIVGWSFIVIQAERLASFIVMRTPTETKKQKTQAKVIRPVKVNVPHQTTDTSSIYGDIEYVVKSGGGWYTIKVDGYDDEMTIRLTKNYKDGEDKFIDALKQWVEEGRHIIQSS